jgi:hypothetical protein
VTHDLVIRDARVDLALVEVAIAGERIAAMGVPLVARAPTSPRH